MPIPSLNSMLSIKLSVTEMGSEDPISHTNHSPSLEHMQVSGTAE